MTLSFNPRLRLDLSSGQSSLRSLKDSTTSLTRGHVPPPVPLPFTLDVEGSVCEEDVKKVIAQPLVNFEKVIALMKGRHTHAMHERHVGCIHKICTINMQGFFLHDLSNCCSLLMMSVERMGQGFEVYASAVVHLLETLAIPFQKRRSSDDTRFEAAICTAIEIACQLASEAPPPMACLALEMLLSVCVPPPPVDSNAEAIAREAMAIGPRVENLKVLALVVRANVLPAIIGAVSRAVAESGGGLMCTSSRFGTFLGAPPAWNRGISAALRILRAAARSAEGASQIISTVLSSILC